MENVYNALVRATWEKIQVYRLKDGRYNLFLGDEISLSKIEDKQHMRTFKEGNLLISIN